jgi:hypothetical protein
VEFSPELRFIEPFHTSLSFAPRLFSSSSRAPYILSYPLPQPVVLLLLSKPLRHENVFIVYTPLSSSTGHLEEEDVASATSTIDLSATLRHA